jgi:hypothetical protein
MHRNHRTYSLSSRDTQTKRKSIDQNSTANSINQNSKQEAKKTRKINLGEYFNLKLVRHTFKEIVGLEGEYLSYFVIY